MELKNDIMSKEKIAQKEIEVFGWMKKKGYDRRASKDIAPIIVEYLTEFKLLDLHHVVGQSVQFICPKCKSDWGVINAVCFECEHEKDISK